jgi:MT-A70
MILRKTSAPLAQVFSAPRTPSYPQEADNLRFQYIASRDIRPDGGQVIDIGLTSQPTPTQIKQAKREAREIALAAKQLALPDKRYGVIVADPPWRWEPYSRETGMDRSADNHYVTAGTEEIARLPVADIAAPDCVLWLWAISSMLPDALFVMRRWGFTYKTAITAVKLSIIITRQMYCTA